MVVVLIQLVHAFLLWILPFYPYPEFFIYPYLASHGFLPYAHILDQHFPGLMFFPINLYTLGFRDPLSFKILMIGVVLFQSSLIYLIAKKLANRTIAILACGLFAVWQPFFDGSQFWINSLLPLLLLPAFWFFYHKKWLLAGFCIGLAVIFKQTLVPLAIFLSVFILIDYKKKSLEPLVKYCLAGLLPSVLMLLYFYKIGVLANFWYWTIHFNLATYAKEGTLAPTIGQVLKLTLPGAIVLLSLFVTRFQSLARSSAFWLVLSVLGGIARFEFIHFLPAIPFFTLCGGILIYNWWQDKRKVYLLVLLVLTTIWLSQFYSKQQGYLTTHYFDQTSLDTVEIIKSQTQPGDRIFLLGVNPHLYSLSATFPPDHVFVFQFPWFLHIAGNRILASLKNDPPKLIVYDSASVIDGHYLKDYAADLVHYTMSNYTPFYTLGTITFYDHRH